MTAEKVCVDYDSLKDIARIFKSESGKTSTTLNKLQRQLDVLLGGAWKGQGATEFFQETIGEVLPAVKRLADALEQAGRITQRISQVMRQAEDEASKILNGDGIRAGGTNLGAVGGGGAGAHLTADSGAASQSVLGKVAGTVAGAATVPLTAAAAPSAQSALDAAGRAGAAAQASGSPEAAELAAHAHSAAQASAAAAQAGQLEAATAYAREAIGAAQAAEAAANAYLSPAELIQTMPGLTPERAEQLAPLVNQAMNESDINTPERQRMFLAQIGHESQDMNRLVENLNYSRERLLEVFPGRFNEQTAAEYAHDPERIANHAYANRLGNGDEAGGDGWRFRGRGAIQITGRDNYEEAGQALGLDLGNHPELVEDPEISLRVSAWWWQNHGLNERVDANPEDVRGVTRVINPGQRGLPDRQNRFNRININGEE